MMYWTRNVYGRQRPGRLFIAAWPFLWLGSLAYQAVFLLRSAWYAHGLGRCYEFPAVHVISVGNATVGGTGKTPLVALIIQELLARGKKIAVISRGYGARRFRDGMRADEPEMLRRCFPAVSVIVNPRRPEGIRRAQEQGCTHVILDDAFQNISVRKNTDIVCVSSPDGFGNGRMLPAGPLRVPLRWLKRADVIVLTHQGQDAQADAALTDRLRLYNQRAPVCRARYVAKGVRRCGDGKSLDPGVLAGRDVGVLAGIAFPERVAVQAAQIGANVREWFYFPDHHYFTARELEQVAATCARQGLRILVTTAKDESRLLTRQGTMGSLDVYVIDVALALESDGQECVDRLCGVSAA